jgi:hypothetical protein
MRVIFSAKSKKKKKNKKLKKYWQLLEPKSYTDLMVAQTIEKFIKQSAQKLEEVELKGILKQTKDKFVYIKIDNDFIKGVFPLISNDGAEEPPYFGKGEIGAHISAITKDEIEGKNIEKIDELGEEIPFYIKGVFSTNPAGWSEMSRVWFVTIDCPRIVEIRKKYKLPATYDGKGHDFHITVAVRKVKKRK